MTYRSFMEPNGFGPVLIGAGKNCMSEDEISWAVGWN